MTSSDTDLPAQGAMSSTRRCMVNVALAMVLLLVGHAWLPAAETFDQHMPSIDECGWLAISHATYQEFSNGDLAAVDWKDGLHKTTFGGMNPNLAKLMFGWLLALDGYELAPPKVFPALNPEAQGRMKNRKFVMSRVGSHESFLVGLRAFNVWLMAAAGVGIFLVGLLLSGRALGILAWGLFLGTPLVRDLAPLVMTDNLLLALLLAGLLAVSWSLGWLARSTVSLSANIPLMASVGIVLGLVASTKLNGALSCVAFGIALLGLWLTRRFDHHPRWQPSVWIGISAMTACGVFLLLYPLLWGDLRGGLDYIFERWDTLLERQSLSFPRGALDSMSARLGASWNRGVVGIGPAWLPSWLVAALVGGGLVRLITKAIAALRDHKQAPSSWILLCFLLVWVVGTALWIPLDWPRYYLPVIVFSCLLAALPVADLCHWLMTRFLNSPRRTTASTALLTLALAAPSCSDGEPAPTAPPHILLLTVDTLRPDYLGMYGYDRETSPYLDSLLADAFHFPKAVTTVPRTTPALASLLTGAFPHHTGVRVLTHALRDEVTPITEVLQADGYRTLAVVTNQMLRPERKLSRGFDLYLDAKDTRDAAATTDVALELLEKNDFSQPLFLWAHFIDPHMPYVADPSLIASFDPQYDGRYAQHFGQFPKPRKAGQQGRRRRAGPYPPDLPKAVAVHRNPLPQDVVEHVRRLYAADIRSTDDQIRRLVERLLTLTDGNLLIVFTADHGESLGEHDFYWDHGDYVYNAASRIPLAILPPPGHPARGAGSYDHWVSIIDIVPTIFDLLGREIPPSMRAQMDGRSLAPAMRGDQLEPRPVFVESGHSHFFELIHGRAENTVAGNFRAVYSGQWKLIWAPGHADPRQSWQIFDLAADPHETNNLYAPDHPQFKRLRDLLEPWAEKSLGMDTSDEASAADLELLKELGYVDPGD